MENRELGTEPIDSRWYERFQTVGSFQAYEYLDGDKQARDTQREQFQNGQIENPELDYPQINPAQLDEREAELLTLKNDILREEPDETVKQVYRWRLNEKIAEVRMLKAASQGDMKRFKRYSQFIYGSPSQEVYEYTLQEIGTAATEASTSDNPDLQKAATDLLSVLPVSQQARTELSLPHDEDVNDVRTQTLSELNDLLSLEGNAGMKFTDEEIRMAFITALGHLKADGWSVVLDTTSKSGISTDQEHKEIRIPQAKSLTYNSLVSLVAHEVGTHVARRVNGERSRLQLLGLGLDRYEQGEEGIATMRQQVLEEGVDHFAGLEGHFSIALATGMDSTPRNFREVYTVMERWFYLKALAAGKDAGNALKSAQTNAWNRTVRTFRGTDCKTKGACFTKDIIYREGNIGVWGVVRSNPEELMRFSIGKYDPSNPRHVWVLDQLGITDSDLSYCEE